MIEFDNVGKLYRLGLVGTGTLCHDLNRWWQTKILRHEDPYQKIGITNDRTQRSTSDYVWALQHITFSVEKGQVVGIIGKNGAGKSTLLKLLSRVTAPTTGSIRAQGRIASLLEVGTGFHPEMTGRENIYMNGSIMGMRKHEIDAKLDEIVDFSGVELYLDTPVKRYSSGMWVRLGFAIAAFLDPDILVVDEVLAVGDAEFQKKAIGRMKDVSHGEGRTVLFVSHNMGAVRSLCQRGIVLANGEMAYDAPIEDALAFYQNLALTTDSKRTVDAIKFCRSYIHVHELLINGTDEAYSEIKPDQRHLDVSLTATTDVPLKVGLKIIFRTPYNQPLAACEEGTVKGIDIEVPAGRFTLSQRIALPDYLSRGDYHIDFILNKPMVEDYLQALNCATLHCDGQCDPFARPLYQQETGLCSLPALSTDLAIC